MTPERLKELREYIRGGGQYSDEEVIVLLDEIEQLEQEAVRYKTNSETFASNAVALATDSRNLQAREYKLMQEVKQLRAALEKVEKLEGAYDMDQLQHAKNTLENVREIARTALKESK
jgi:uncharacterized protein YlxW (UPF0749 family)